MILSLAATKIMLVSAAYFWSFSGHYVPAQLSREGMVGNSIEVVTIKLPGVFNDREKSRCQSTDGADF